MSREQLDQKLHATNNPISAYAERPRHVHFQDQEPDESIELLLRRHPVTNLKWIVSVTLLALVPFILALPPVADILVPQYLRNTVSPAITIGLLLLYDLILIGVALESFFVWYFNVYLISNKRLVDCDFTGLLHYSSAETLLTQIQDVEHSRGGLTQAIWDFGEVGVQTAGTERNFIFEFIPKPARVADIITDLIPAENDRTYRNLANAVQQQEGLAPHLRGRENV